MLFGLLFGTDGHAHADECAHVECAINVGNMGQRVIGAADDAVHLSDVRPVISSDHDGVEGGGGPFKMHQQAAFVALRFDGASEHLKTCFALRPSLFGVVGLFLGFTTM